MASCIEKRPHALVVPSTGQGHVSGCMLLARALAARGFRVTFVYFSTSYAKLKESNRLVLPYPSGTPQGEAPLLSSQSTTHANGSAGNKGLIELRVVEDGIQPGDIEKPPFFNVTNPTMQQNLFNLILELREHHTPPTCLVSHHFVPWTLHVAERAHIPRIVFWTSNALACLLLINVPHLFSRGVFPETEARKGQWKPQPPLMLDHIPGLPPFPSEIYAPHMRFAHPSDPWGSLFTEVAIGAKRGERILIHTMPGVEEQAFRAYQVAGIPAYGIGPLLYYGENQPKRAPASSKVEGEAGVIRQGADSISWLDTQADSSVIYIAFGSLVRLSEDEIQELAFGLEASGRPFFWAIREDSLGGAKLTQVLPEGFRERTSDKGMVMGWAPQVEVLAHRAIGGFLSHCGWNSLLESMWQGVPLLCCPQFAEQRLNMRYLCDVWGAGIELERTDTGGLDRKLVELGVKALMQEDVGLEARGKAQEMREVVRTSCQPGGQSYSNLQKFYMDMESLCSQATTQ